MEEKTRIAILCGGRGIRLKPLTDDIPKPLVPVEGKAILHHALEVYSKNGFNDFILCLGYKGHLIKDYFKNVDGYNILFSDAGEDASMLQRIHKLNEHVKDRIIVSYGDTYSHIDLKKLLEKHKSSSASVTIATTQIESPFGLIDIHESGKVLSYREKPTLNYYIGYFVIEKKALEGIPKELIEIPTNEGLVSFFKMLAEQGKLFAYNHEGLHITFNTHSEKNISDNIFKYFTYGDNHEK